LHAVADRLEYDGTRKTSQFQGHARLWQGESFLVEGESIDWSPSAGELAARKKVYSVFRQIPGGPDSNKPAPRAAASRPAASLGKDASITIRADSFLYRHLQRLAHYEGGVQMQNASGIVTASEMDIFLEQPASQSSSDLSLNAGQIDRAVAKDHVRIAEGARVATGDRAEYLPARGEVHLFGQLAKVSDPARGTVEGPQLTYFLGDDRIQVQGSPGLPTETRWQVHP
jgi:lipopolysaccharide transport protein LptA